jgi:hypothetical protein
MRLKRISGCVDDEVMFFLVEFPTGVNPNGVPVFSGCVSQRSCGSI